MEEQRLTQQEITDERVKAYVRRSFCCSRQQSGSSCGAEEGTIVSILGNEGTIAQTWVNVTGGLRVFSVYFWHSEGWTPRNEALLTTRHHIPPDILG